jgi:hypothetical protein
MADSTVEIDLDSVIDRLLEGQFYDFSRSSSFFSQAPEDTSKTDAMDRALALPRCHSPGPRWWRHAWGLSSCRQPARIRHNFRGNQPERLFARKRHHADRSTMATAILHQFFVPPPPPVTHQMLIVFTPFNSAR